MNLFDGGADYADYRPSYPAELPRLLAGLISSHDVAVDVGCGTGQLTAPLGEHFDSVLGIDPSESQIANATAADGVRYDIGDAENLPLADDSVDLVTVAQAAHWFPKIDLFYDEARRVARDGAALALISYGVCHFSQNPELDRVYQEFYHGDFHRHWEPSRHHVETALRELPFPFETLDCACPDIVRHLDLAAFTNYLHTWSAMKSPGALEEFEAFTKDLAAVWGKPTSTHEIRWPVAVRAGRVG